MKSNHYIIILGLSLILDCHTTFTSFKVPDNTPDTELVLVRRFNMEIEKINGEKVSNLYFDFKLLPGKYNLIIRPEMHQSSFPDPKNFEGEKEFSFEAKAGQIVYLCLGIQKSDKAKDNKYPWRPYSVIVYPTDDIRSKLLTALDSQGGCTSPRYTLPYSWITW